MYLFRCSIDCVTFQVCLFDHWLCSMSVMLDVVKLDKLDVTFTDFVMWISEPHNNLYDVLVFALQH